MSKLCTFLFAYLFFGIYTIHGQNCATNLSLFAEDVKSKNYTNAEVLLKTLRSECPKVSSALYAYGEVMFKAQLKTLEGEEKVLKAKQLIKLYQDRMHYMSSKTKQGNILAKIAQLMNNYNIGTQKEQYQMYDKAFTTDLVNFKDPKRLYNYFKLYFDMYTSKEAGITLAALMEKSAEINEKFETEKLLLTKIKNEIITKNNTKELFGKDKKNFDRANKNIKAIDIFSKSTKALLESIATCETLVPLYREGFEEHKNDSTWLRRALERLETKSCTTSEMFETLANQLDMIAPSSYTKYLCYSIYTKKRDFTEATKCLVALPDFETDNIKKSKLLYKIGKMFEANNQDVKALQYYQKAIDSNPSLGKVYLKIANIYAKNANACGENVFTKRAVYWKAAEMSKKAVKIDPSLKNIAAKATDAYLGRAPSKADIHISGMAGKRITFKCTIGGSVIVPDL